MGSDQELGLELAKELAQKLVLKLEEELVDMLVEMLGVETDGWLEEDLAFVLVGVLELLMGMELDQ